MRLFSISVKETRRTIGGTFLLLLLIVSAMALGGCKTIEKAAAGAVIGAGVVIFADEIYGGGGHRKYKRPDYRNRINNNTDAYWRGVEKRRQEARREADRRAYVCGYRGLC